MGIEYLWEWKDIDSVIAYTLRWAVEERAISSEGEDNSGLGQAELWRKWIIKELIFSVQLAGQW